MDSNEPTDAKTGQVDEEPTDGESAEEYAAAHGWEAGGPLGEYVKVHGGTLSAVYLSVVFRDALRGGVTVASTTLPGGRERPAGREDTRDQPDALTALRHLDALHSEPSDKPHGPGKP